MLTKGQDYTSTVAGFRWDIPARYNIGVDICDRWAAADPDRLALIDVTEGAGNAGTRAEYTFGALKEASDRLANALAALGVSRGGGGLPDRGGGLLPQRVDTALAHIAVTKMGCISIPLFTLFGPEALAHRLGNSGARVVITDAAGAAKLAPLRAGLPDLAHVISVEGAGLGVLGLADLCAAASADFTAADTLAEDPAILIYTSGTTGNPKGALHAHRVLPGHLPGVEISHDFLPQPGDRIWTPADWAWIGGLLDVLMPALHHGVPVVACRFAKFTGRAAADLIRAEGIRNVFLPPTALKIMRADADLGPLNLRSVGSGGETLGGELIDWGRRVLGATINEFYGQTECNMIVSACAALEEPAPGVMGRPVPGHRVAVIEPATGAVLASGQEGTIAVLAPDPVMFLGYLNDPVATEAKFVTGPEGRWLLTGDRGQMEPDGRLRFIGRDDDVIGSAGYRIGPAEVEDCLLRHPAVRLAGVVGAPDPIRGAVVVAFVTLAEGFVPSDALADEIAQHVKARLAAHEYPRRVYFIDAMPMTTTGKIIRNRLREMAAAG